MKIGKENNIASVPRYYEWIKDRINIIYVLWFLFVLYVWFHNYQILPSNLDFDGIFAPLRASFIYYKNLPLVDIGGFPPLYGFILVLSYYILPVQISTVVFVSTVLGIIVVISLIYVVYTVS